MDILITGMSAGVAVLDVVLVALIAALFSTRLRGTILRIVNRNALPLFTALSLVSVLGTLYMEYAALLAPCLFCWWQRIFMYPILVISLVALFKRAVAREIADYVLALSVFGFAVALYQHFLQILPSGSLIPCDAANECAVRSVFEFGFVTIPWMAVTVFAMLAFVALVARKNRSLTEGSK